jgi:cysteine desulfurase
MTRQAVYCDHNASTPLLPEARAALLSALDLIGNPSSVHAEGRALRALIDQARADVAALTGARREEVVFTGSATEAITQAIVGGARHFRPDAVVVTAGDHMAVLRAAELTGLPIRTIGLHADGRIDLEDLTRRVTEATKAGETLLVAVHAVNNETGIVQPVEQIEALVGPTPHILFIDAVQALGKLDLGFMSRPADMMAVSAHKIGGPTGVGALLVKSHADAVRLIPGGGQESNRRGGTEPAALIAGFGAAAKAFPERYRAAGVAGLIAGFESALFALAPDAVIFGGGALRIGNVTNFAVPGLKNAVAMMGLDLAGIAVSSGSACSSGKVGVSHVLGAMQVDPALKDSALRVSLGWNSTRADIEALTTGLAGIMARHKSRDHRAA